VDTTECAGAISDQRSRGTSRACGVYAESVLDAEVPPDAPPVSAADYFLTVGDPDDPLDAPRQRMVREIGERDAGNGPDDLAERFDAARARMATRLEQEDPDRLVVLFGPTALTLNEALITRLIEMVVHVDDLAVSLDVPTPDVPDEAAETVILTMARIARKRRGDLPLIRALSRRERGPYLISAF
jgi:uncharacterized protein (TIGR03083 family)